ncbi:permease [Piscibacillus sp. B03]|uniref:permease n=1 Tax=Piscibacillus sp. B03 TaxID=3457430 RepID=UPI003FCE4FB9
MELTILFIVVSFLVNLIQNVIPYKKLEYKLNRANIFTGSILAIFLAFITPFCSCSTIPVVASMLQNKMRFGLVMVFLFASPVLDPTILTIMTVLFGWEVSVVYAGITSVLSIFVSISLEKFGFEKAVKSFVFKNTSLNEKKFSIKASWFETKKLMKTAYPYLIMGALIGSIIHGAVPTHWIANTFGGNEWWLIPIAAIVGIPLYIRLSTMIQIANIMIIKGMALGPVMAIMISSSGASLPELTLLHSIFEKKLVIAFIFSVLFMATMSGTLFYFI